MRYTLLRIFHIIAIITDLKVFCLCFAYDPWISILQLIEVVLSFGESIERIADAEKSVVDVMRVVNGLDEMTILRQARKLPQYVSATLDKLF